MTAVVRDYVSGETRRFLDWRDKAGRDGGSQESRSGNGGEQERRDEVVLGNSRKIPESYGPTFSMLFGKTIPLPGVSEVTAPQEAAGKVGEEGDEAVPADPVLENALRQADELAKSLKLNAAETWSMRSTAEDLALFGLDFTALSGDASELLADLSKRAGEKLADAERKFGESPEKLEAERARINGAFLRLKDGLQKQIAQTGDKEQPEPPVHGSGAEPSISVNPPQPQFDRLVAKAELEAQRLRVILESFARALRSGIVGISMPTPSDRAGSLFQPVRVNFSATSQAMFFTLSRQAAEGFSRLLSRAAPQPAPTANPPVSAESRQVTVGSVTISVSAALNVGLTVVDPLVLDLNGDGLDLKSADDGVDFDLYGTGEKKKSGFIRGDDAFLFLDADGDGIVSDGSELFGTGGSFANGFDQLAQYDENGDGVIDENDQIYERLRLWQDKDGDGASGSGEVMTLREAGVKSISLKYQDVRQDDGKGNLVGQTGGFERFDGSSGLAADVWLRQK